MNKPGKSQMIWVAVIVPITIAIIGAVQVSIDWEVSPDEPGEPTAIYRNLEFTSKVYEVLWTLRRETGAAKVVLLRAHDSGTAIPTKSTVMAEAIAERAEPVLNEWHEQKLDGPYVAMLEQLLTTHRFINITADMERSTLKDVYLSRGVALADVRLLGANDVELWYLSIVYQDIPVDYDPGSRRLGPAYEDDVRVGSARLRKLLREMKAIR